MNPFTVLNWLIFVTFYSIVPILVYFNGNFNYYCDFLKTSIGEDESTQVYDFIVVGSGSAGGIIGNRLSKNSHVLVLEGGGTPLYLNSIPGLAPNMLGGPVGDWKYYTVPQNHSQFGMNEQRSYWPRGKFVGGSSVLNFMTYVRAHPLDYDLWANLTGDPEWNYENVLPFFKKSISYKGRFQNNHEHYGSSPYGYLHVEDQNHSPLHNDFMAAGKELGFDVDIDLNGPQRTGFGIQEVTQKNGRRWSVYDAFISDFEQRENLKISRYSQAVKIQLDKNNRATGVFYLKHGKKKLARASKEIILSCGSVDSPKLLMLSGIGPKEHLSSLNIQTKADLPVGKFLKDHVAINLYPFLLNEKRSYIADRDFGFQTLVDYFIHGKGSLTSPVESYSQAFYSTSKVKKSGVDWPDIQLYKINFGVYGTIAQDLSAGLNTKPGYFESMFEPIQGRDMFTFMSTLGRPKSSGDLKLASKDPSESPLLNPNYLKHKDDVDALVEGIKLSIKLGEETEPYRKMGGALADQYIRKGCEHHETRSDAFWECYVRHHARTLYHPVGTCRMGKNIGDPNAVVDSHLRVLRVKSLRVADASVMPELVNGNTHAPTMMIGEKAADMIRSYWASQYLVCSNNFKELLETRLFNNDKKCYYSLLA